MKQPIFRKEVSATGKYGTFKAEIIATMNYGSKTVTGTHAGTHDDYEKQIPVHKVDVFINKELVHARVDLESETALYKECELAIKLASERIHVLATDAPVKSFIDKMWELFS